MSKVFCFIILFVNFNLFIFSQCGTPIEQYWKYVELNGMEANMRIIYKDDLFGLVRNFAIFIDLENDSFQTTNNSIEKCIDTNCNFPCKKYEINLVIHSIRLIKPEISADDLDSIKKIFKYLPSGTMKFKLWLESFVLRKYPDTDDFKGDIEFEFDITQEGNTGYCVIGNTESIKMKFLQDFSLDPTSPIKNTHFKFKGRLIPPYYGIFNNCSFGF